MNKFYMPGILLLLLVATVVYISQAGNDIRKRAVAAIALSDEGWLGVMIEDVSEDLAKEKNLSVHMGVYVRDVIEDSPADSAGIVEGDVILKVDGNKVDDSDELVKAIRKIEPGTTVPVVVIRGKSEETLQVRIGTNKGRIKTFSRILKVPSTGRVHVERGPAHEKALEKYIWSSRSSGTYGLSLKTLGKQLGEYFGAPKGKGVLVEEVHKDSKAEKAGFKAGDVIVKAGKKTVTKAQDFKNVLRAYDPGEKIPVVILRKGSKKTIQLEVVETKEHGDIFEMHSEDSDFHIMSPRKFRMYVDKEDCEMGDMDVDVDVDLDELKEDLKDMEFDLHELDEELQGKIRIKIRKSLEDAEKELKEAGKHMKDSKRKVKRIRIEGSKDI